ncbi:hypothetical protein TIFTF001_023588 [Ficus carica]|uniref:Uncharacterized protein n=1 Tax=Ficus carica TaxID=3494 RepID=A0AA88DDW7_FICCA|nr:hypothetical protein TIFTF001_023588 [Ficus carica]
MDGCHQKRREKANNTWVQGQQSSKEEGEDNGHLRAERKGLWALGRQSSGEKGRMGTGMTIVKTERNGVRDGNHQEWAQWRIGSNDQ